MFMMGSNFRQLLTEWTFMLYWKKTSGLRTGRIDTLLFLLVPSLADWHLYHCQDENHISVLLNNTNEQTEQTQEMTISTTTAEITITLRLLHVFIYSFSEWNHIFYTIEQLRRLVRKIELKKMPALNESREKNLMRAGKKALNNVTVSVKFLL